MASRTMPDETIDETTRGAASGCPVHGQGTARRKTGVAEPRQGPAPAPEQSVAQGPDGVWHVRGYREARALLRGSGTQQAGFQADQLRRMPTRMRPPILFQEGTTHREQRRKTARFFTPKATDSRYRDLMNAYADEMVAILRREGRADLSELSMTMAVRVAGEVVGLTNSVIPGMAGRIEAFFDQREGAGPITRAWRALRNQARVARFYLLDVQPAIRARKRAPREDVISHLIEEGYDGIEILTECITFAAAGMVTTREFISVAAWHLLEHPELRARYLQADEEERYAILHELLRLEPVVGHILRRAEEPLTLESEGEQLTIPAGALIDLQIHEVNADERAVGEVPLDFCPERARAEGVQPYVMSFGDGHHRCPGAYIAIQESDIFLTRLLALDGLTMERSPLLGWSDVVKGYEVREFWIRLDRAAAPTPPA